MTEKENRRRRQRRLAPWIIFIVFLPIILSFGALRTAKVGQRKALKAFRAEFPAAEILETEYEGNPLRPDSVTIYAIDTEMHFPFVSKYRPVPSDRKSYQRSEGELNGYEQRLRERQATESVLRPVTDYLGSECGFSYRPDGGAGCAVFTQETDRDKLTALYDAMRAAASQAEVPVPFSIIIADAECYETLFHTDPDGKMHDSSYYRGEWSGDLQTELPVFWEGQCSSVEYHYEQNPARGFDLMDADCAQNSLDRFIRQLHSDPNRTEYIMTAFRVW